MVSTGRNLCPDCGRDIPRDTVRGMCMACITRVALPDLSNQEEPSGPAGHPNDHYGSWEVLAKAGEGAFGLVYEAAQESPLQRRAALKVLKPGLDSREVMTRFAAERETLAVLDHPGIARVLDAGTEAGRPWFAAEWVEDALTLTEYCCEKDLPRTE